MTPTSIMRLSSHGPAQLISDVGVISEGFLNPVTIFGFGEWFDIDAGNG